VKALKKTSFVSYVKFECTDCDAVFDGKNAQGCAARHAKAHGHVVIGDVHVSSRYEGVDK